MSVIQRPSDIETVLDLPELPAEPQPADLEVIAALGDALVHLENQRE